VGGHFRAVVYPNVGGVRPVVAMMSASTAQRWSAVQERNGRVAKTFRVYSSMTLSNRTWRPSTVRSV